MGSRNKLLLQRLLVGILCGCGILVLACTQQDGEAIRLGLIVQRDTSDATSTVRTVQLAVDAFNEAGGLLVDGEHRRVALLVDDPAGRPEEATAATLRMINQQGVFALVGPSRSINAIPAAAVADKAGIPMISPSSTNVATTADKPFVFRVTYTDPVQGAGMASFARRRLAAHTAAVLFDETNAYSRGLAEAFRAAFENDRGEVAVYAGFVGDEWLGTLETIRDHAPDVLFLPSFEEVLVPQARRVRALGIKATLLGSDSWPVTNLADMDALDGAYMAVPWHADAATENPRPTHFLAAYQEAWGEPLSYVTPALAYDAAGMILEALRQAGRPDPRAVRDALADLADYPGVTGNITLRGTAGDPAQQGVVLQLRAGQAHYVQRMQITDSATAHLPLPPGGQ